MTSIGQRRVCNESATLQYITDRRGQLWSFLNGHFHKVPKFSWKMARKQVGMIKIASFTRKLVHYETHPPPRTTLLSILNQNHNNLEELMDLRETGSGSMIIGIGKVLGTTISSLAAGSSQIIRSVGAGIKDTLSGISDLDVGLVSSIGNATEKVVSAGAKGIASILSPFGGISGVILYILVFALYAYLIYEKIRHITDCASKMLNRTNKQPVYTRPAHQDGIYLDRSTPRESSTSSIRERTHDTHNSFPRQRRSTASHLETFMEPSADSRWIMTGRPPLQSEVLHERSDTDPPSPIPPPKPFLRNRSQPIPIPDRQLRRDPPPQSSIITPENNFFTNGQPLTLHTRQTRQQRPSSPIYASA